MRDSQHRFEMISKNELFSTSFLIVFITTSCMIKAYKVLRIYVFPIIYLFPHLGHFPYYKYCRIGQFHCQQHNNGHRPEVSSTSSLPIILACSCSLSPGISRSSPSLHDLYARLAPLPFSPVLEVFLLFSIPLNFLPVIFPISLAFFTSILPFPFLPVLFVH